MRNNLSPEAAPWGREIERRISGLESQMSTLVQDNSNALSGLAASLSQMATQLGDIQTAVDQSNTAIQRLNQFSTSTVAGATMVADSSGTGLNWSTTYTEVEVVTPPNCTITVDFGGNAAAVYTPSSPAVGSTVRTFLSFEEVGSPDLYLGSGLTTAALWVPIQVGVGMVRAPLFKSTVAYLNSGHEYKTRTFRLHAGVAGFGTTTANGYIDNPVLSVKVAPRSS